MNAAILALKKRNLLELYQKSSEMCLDHAKILMACRPQRIKNL